MVRAGIALSALLLAAAAPGETMLSLRDLESHPIIPEPRQTEFGAAELTFPPDNLTAVLPAGHAFPSVAEGLTALFGPRLSIIRIGQQQELELAAASGYILVGSPSANPLVARALAQLRLEPRFGSDSPEAYVLAVRRNQAGQPFVVLAGQGEAGDFYALQSLRQLLRPAERGWTIREGVVRDWPSFRYRGIRPVQGDRLLKTPPIHQRQHLRKATCRRYHDSPPVREWPRRFNAAGLDRNWVVPILLRTGFLSNS